MACSLGWHLAVKNILIATVPFCPSVGGVETVSRLLAEEWTRMGHTVVVATATSSPDLAVTPAYRIVRRPSFLQMVRLYLDADLIILQGMALRLGWPALFLPRRIIVVHHLVKDGTQPWTGLRRWLARRAEHVAVSRAVADSLPCRSHVIANPYSTAEFIDMTPALARERDLVFVGRLVGEKGADLAIAALLVLRARGVFPTLTIIGDGREAADLGHLIKEHALQNQVMMLGTLTGGALVKELNRHRIMLVPSRWKEPFGIVALEGIACGCLVIGSNEGGLPDAIGDCGLVFPNNDATALADCIQKLLSESETCLQMRKKAAAHLQGHEASAIARRYLDVMKASIGPA